ncbi:MAG: hypothetical protein JNJ43_14005 [Anaerolineales bacterium]|nr:hypothetical protein [Anaerolineales bacterium]
MKHFIIFGLLFVLLTACGESKPPFTDNGNSGQIKVIVFYDDNKNGVMDSGETGAQAQSVISISQDISCPPTTNPPFVDTDINGLHEFKDLKPGKYCIALSNGYAPITKMTQEVYVSSEMITTVMVGIVKQ